MMVVAANNFLVPNGTFIVEIIAFLILLGVLAKWVYPPVNKAATQRQERIRQQFEEGEQAKARAEQAEKEHRDAIANMRSEAARLREEARAEGQQIVADARTKAQEEAQRIAQSAQESLEAQRQQIMRQMRSEVGQLAVDLSQRIVGESLDEERQHRVIDRFLTDLEAEGGATANGTDTTAHAQRVH
ncbi:MAG: F0F1 ATP synthase subunit B [Streptosporangiales bacterium]